MKITDITKEDGIALVVLMNSLRAATFEKITSKDIDALQSAKSWLAALAKQAAEQLGPAKASASTTSGMKIKSAGPLPGKLKATPAKAKKAKK